MEILIGYCAITYLFTIGICWAGFNDAKEERILTGMIAHLVLAPIVTPICLGWGYYRKKTG